MRLITVLGAQGGVDWGQAGTAIGVLVAAAVAAYAAYRANRAVQNPPVVIQAPAVPLALLEKVPITDGGGIGGHPSEIAATILPWHPASYIPAWNQNKGVLPDGNLDAEHWNDCGETACSMVIAGCWGCPVEPGAIRQWLVGPTGSGLTDGNALVRALAHWSVKSHLELLGGDDGWKTILDCVASQRPVIMLGTWEGPGTFLHWVVAVSDGNETVQFCDPWNGSRSFFTKSQWYQFEATQLVVLDSHMHFDCRTWPDPS